MTIIVDETSEGVRARVLDEGAGIDPGESARLFELYYRSPTNSSSVSAPASACSSVARWSRRWAADIWASRRPEGGAEFGFVLARHEEDEARDW